MELRRTDLTEARVLGVLDRAWDASRLSARVRLGRLRSKIAAVVQCAVAAGLAWWVAADLLHHVQPLFAPVIAVVCLGMTYGQRLRRVLEVTVGVALGVFVADAFVQVAGSGPWQIALVVLASMAVALLLDAGNLLVTQSAVQSIAVTALTATPGQALNRWVDALIGGACALLLATLVPQAALRRPRVAAAQVVGTMADLLDAAARAARDRDVDAVAKVLATARATDGLLVDLQAAANEGLSVVASSPFRRAHAPSVRKVADLLDPLDRAMRSTRVLVRRVAVTAGRDEHLPESYLAAMQSLADGARVVSRALSENASPTVGQGNLRAVAHEIAALPRTETLSAETVLAQLRSMVVDLLQLTGLEVDDAVAALPRERPRA